MSNRPKSLQSLALSWLNLESNIVGLFILHPHCFRNMFWNVNIDIYMEDLVLAKESLRQSESTMSESKGLRLNEQTDTAGGMQSARRFFWEIIQLYGI